MSRLAQVIPYESPGYRRVRRAGSFRYLRGDGRAAPRPEHDRIEALAIPPAWERVWISASGDAHILAVGEDGAGRRQYLYHPAWREAKDQEKFRRAYRLAAALPAARRLVTADLRSPGVTRERVLAAAFRILDSVALRVGSEQYALVHGSRGLTTLERGDVSLKGPVSLLRFPAKSGQRADARIEDEELAQALAALGAGSGTRRIFAWRQDGVLRRLTAADVNGYIGRRTAGPFTAKDFRTLRGTIIAALSLARARGSRTEADRRAAIRAAIAEAAAGLGNTPAVARASYVDPAILVRFEQGSTLRLDRSPESALLELLERS